MNYLAEAFTWCVAQVTLFTAVAACSYGIAKRLGTHGQATLLVITLGIVGLLTLMCISPWPRWVSPASPPIATRPAPRPVVSSGIDSHATFDDRSARRSLARRQAREAPADETPTASPLPQRLRVLASELPSIRWWLSLLWTAWVIIAVGLLRFTMGVVCLWRYCRASVSLIDPQVNALLNDLRRETGITQSVRLRESPRLGVAATAGVGRPMILLPASWRAWSVAERRAVLAHELAHIKQWHFAAWLFIQLPLVAHYYHPLVHWLARQLRFEQEIAADRLAARVFGERSHYATVLAGLALSPPPRGPLVSLGLFMSRPLLMRRIAMLRQTNEPAGRVSRYGKLLAILLIAATAIGVAGLRAPRTAEAQLTDQAAPPPAPNYAGDLHNYPALEDERRSAPAAESLLLVSRRPPQIIDQAQREPLSDNSWTIFTKTQLALLRSHFVLQAALRDPQIAKFRLVQSAADPMALLHERLEVGFYDGSAVMFVRMPCSPGECEDARKVVDAVVDAFMKEVVVEDRQRRLAIRDRLAASLKGVSEEVSRKLQDYLEIARDSGRTESESGQMLQELDMKRLDRIENELMRLESERLERATSGQSSNSEFYAERIAQLHERQAELEKKIITRSEQSVDLTLRHRELEQLERIANDMAMQLEYMDIEANAPEQIQVIQRAVTTGRPQRASDPARN